MLHSFLYAELLHVNRRFIRYVTFPHSFGVLIFLVGLGIDVLICLVGLGIDVLTC